MAIRFIYFDLGKVLLDFTHERGFAQLANVAGIREEEVRAAMVQRGLSDRYEVGELSTTEFHAAFCDLTGTSASIEALATAWGDIFEIKPDTISLAARLRAAGHRIGILSNTCAAHWEDAASRFPMLGELFDPVITSYEVKSMKPDSKIYQAAADRVGIPPAELFFMDDRQENVTAARELGWNAELFTGARQLADDLERLGLQFNR